jgi:hypothetical protein
MRSQAQIKRREREKLSVCAKAEHVFGVIKKLFDIERHNTRVEESKPENFMGYLYWQI